MPNLEFEKLNPVLSDNLSDLGPAITHGFFTRNGGKSEGIYSSLNTGLGSDDISETVVANRHSICRAFDVDADWLSTVNQVHSADVVTVSQPFRNDRPRADALVTATPRLAIGVLTADCGPVLFADADAGVIGAAHAGWKGAMSGVLENTLAAMVKLGASRENIIATLGPCISQENYEVGPEFLSAFLNARMSNNRYFVPSRKEGHSMFDLTGYVVDRLRDAGVNANAVHICTYKERENFYSYRRSVHLNQPDYGRQISTIVIN